MKKKRSVILAIDIGNTSLKWGIIYGDKIREIRGLDDLNSRRSVQLYFQKYLKMLRRKYSVSHVMICSVVPRTLKKVEWAIKNDLRIRPQVLGRDMHVPMINKYANPRQVGQDRLVGAFAAMQLYGHPVVIIDFGTAITFDVVSRKKEYLGGIIIPGIKLSLDALFKNAALLPQVRIKRPSVLIGKTTQASILSGVFYGYGAMVNALVCSLFKEIKGKPKVVVTGGYSRLMTPFLEAKFTYIDQNLVMKGLMLLYHHSLVKQSNLSVSG